MFAVLSRLQSFWSHLRRFRHAIKNLSWLSGLSVILWKHGHILPLWICRGIPVQSKMLMWVQKQRNPLWATLFTCAVATITSLPVCTFVCRAALRQTTFRNFIQSHLHHVPGWYASTGRTQSLAKGCWCGIRPGVVGYKSCPRCTTSQLNVLILAWFGGNGSEICNKPLRNFTINSS